MYMCFTPTLDSVMNVHVFYTYLRQCNECTCVLHIDKHSPVLNFHTLTTLRSPVCPEANMVLLPVMLIQDTYNIAHNHIHLITKFLIEDLFNVNTETRHFYDITCTILSQNIYGVFLALSIFFSTPINRRYF